MEAVAWVTDAAIERAASTRTGETRRDWKSNGVPWEIVGQLLVARISQEKTATEVHTPALREAPMPLPLRQAQEQLARIFWSDKVDRRKWKLIAEWIALEAPPPIVPVQTDRKSATRRLTDAKI